MTHPNDPYSRLNYRKLIAWPARIEREAPFLKRLFGEAGEGRSLADLGCGTGEHAAYLASLGFRVTGIDRSAANILSAKETHAGVNFVEGDIAECDRLLPGPIDGALSVGNTLPHLETEEKLEALFSAVSRSLRPGGVFLIQILNYTKIFERKERVLAPNIRADDEGEILFLRLMDPRPGGMVLFSPCTLRYRPGAEPPLEVISARNVLLRGWQREEMATVLSRSGFSAVLFHGGMAEEEYQPLDSNDLVIVARR